LAVQAILEVDGASKAPRVDESVRVETGVRTTPSQGVNEPPAQAKEILVRQLGDADEMVRTTALIELRDHLDSSMIPALRSLVDDREPLVRSRAAEYLSALGG
jgi:HEAT repeat protein